MRVLVVTPWFPSASVPGSGIFNLRDAEMLGEDHDVRVLHLYDPANPDSDGDSEWVADGTVTVIRKGFSSARPSTWPAAIRAIKREAAQVEILHTMAFPALLPVSMARVKVPWVHTEHWSGLVSPPESILARVGSVMLRSKLRNPDVVVAVGQPLSSAIDKVRAGHTRTDVIGNSVRLANNGRLPEPPEARNGAPLKLIGVGNLVPGKGPIEAVDAIAELHSRGFAATLSWAGTGSLANQVRQHVDTLGLKESVTLLGFLPPEDLAQALLDSHIFMLPTEGETFGVAIAEALGHGLPVVGSGVGGHQFFLPEDASRLVAERNGIALADAVVSLAEDSARWSPGQIFRYARENFSEEARRDAYRDVYIRAIEAWRLDQGRLLL